MEVLQLLRARHFYPVKKLLLLYKSLVLGFVEYRTPALYHACPSVLEPLDRLQDGLLRDLGLTQEEALEHFGLAPLCTRRDIAMLGLVHRAALGLGPPQFRKFFFPAEQTTQRNTRSSSRRHHLNLWEPRRDRFLELVRRSALGLVAVYNMLPTEMTFPR